VAPDEVPYNSWNSTYRIPNDLTAVPTTKKFTMKQAIDRNKKTTQKQSTINHINVLSR